MKITEVLLATGLGAFFYDDQLAIRAGAQPDGFAYFGDAATPGFSAIRTPARALGIGLELSDGSVLWGDMMSVQYAGAGGRDPVLDPAHAGKIVRETLRPRLIGLSPHDFREACAAVLAPMPGGRRLPVAVEYGTSQALLRAAAHAAHTTMAEVICAQFGCPLVIRPVPLFAQSGDAREVNVDKMILKEVDVLPHGLINARCKFGEHGEAFLQFINWVVHRIRHLGAPSYAPTLHFDVYGHIGMLYDLVVPRIAEFIARAAEAAAPFQLNIESPADFGDRERQIEGFSALMHALDRLGCSARIVADEWCNTLDDIRAFCTARAAHLIQIKTPDVGSVADIARAVLECKSAGIGAYVGGSCAETDLSAQVSVHLAVATQADILLAKPGMGVDEGLSIVGNEQSRLLAMLKRCHAMGATRHE